MRKNKSNLGLFGLMLLLIGGQTLAQSWIIEKGPMPPGFLTQEDLCTFTITAPEPMQVYVVATATGAKLGKIAEVTTEVFSVNAGVNTYSTANSPPISKIWIAPQVEGIIKQTGMFPEDYYTIFVKLFAHDNSLLDDDQLNQQVRYPQIRLIAPEKGSLLTERNPIFQWSIIGEILRRLWEELTYPYELRICEVMPGQISSDAINNIPHFTQKIKPTSFRYPVGAKAFEAGKNYCWQVKLLAQNFPIVASEIWLFGFGQAAAVESCKYYIDEKGQMWHSLGRVGQIGIRPDSCHYVLTKDTTMYHADGQKWTPVTADSCTFIIADNGVFHFNGWYWHQIAVGTCDCILTKNGMFHFNGSAWEAVKPDSCTYVLVKDEKGEKEMQHADGSSWTVVTFEKCKYVRTKFGMYHFNGKTWDLITVKECTGIRAENGMFHFNGKDWIAQKPDSCRYFLASDPVNKKNAMYHGDGQKWNPVTFEKCKYIRALNGMFHFNGKTWDLITVKTCTAILAENGMFHFKDTAWVAVKPDSCTYILVSDPVKKEMKMYHADGKTWQAVTVPVCHYIKAYNGLFHFGPRGWVPVSLPLCKYIKADNGMFHSKGGGQWEVVPGYYCKWIEAVNGWFHHDGSTWNPADSCNYRFEITGSSPTEIKGKLWHHNGKRWTAVVSKSIPIDKPKNCPTCTYYFVPTMTANEYILFHCVKDNQPVEITRIRLE